MDKEIITFGDIEMEKHKIQCCENPVFLDVDTDKVLVSKNISSDKKNYKYFLVTCMTILKLSHCT